MVVPQLVEQHDHELEAAYARLRPVNAHAFAAQQLDIDAEALPPGLNEEIVRVLMIAGIAQA